VLNAAHWRCFDSSSKNSSVNARGGAAMVGIAVFRRSGNVGNVRQPDPRSFFDRGSENRGTLEARRNVIHQPANLLSGLMVNRSRLKTAIGDWSGAGGTRSTYFVPGSTLKKSVFTQKQQQMAGSEKQQEQEVFPSAS